MKPTIRYSVAPAPGTLNTVNIQFAGRISDNQRHFESLTYAQNLAPDWVLKIFTLPGVESVSVQQHWISITKADLFPWDGIVDQAIAIVLGHLGWDGLDVTYAYDKKRV